MTTPSNRLESIITELETPTTTSKATTIPEVLWDGFIRRLQFEAGQLVSGFSEVSSNELTKLLQELTSLSDDVSKLEDENRMLRETLKSRPSRQDIEDEMATEILNAVGASDNVENVLDRIQDYIDPGNVATHLRRGPYHTKGQ